MVGLLEPVISFATCENDFNEIESHQMAIDLAFD